MSTIAAWNIAVCNFCSWNWRQGRMFSKVNIAKLSIGKLIFYSKFHFQNEIGIGCIFMLRPDHCLLSSTLVFLFVQIDCIFALPLPRLVHTELQMAEQYKRCGSIIAPKNIRFKLNFIRSQAYQKIVALLCKVGKDFRTIFV